MRFTHPPFWFWRLDRWKLLAALLLALLALLMGLRGCGAPQVQAPDIALPEVQLPKITLPSVAGLRAGEPVDFDGTAAPGAKVQIYDGDKMIGETVADADGKWRFSLPALAAGAHNVVAKAFDAAGKELGAGEPWQFELPEVAVPEAETSPYPKPYEVTLEPGATLSVPVRGYCLNYGKPFPGQSLTAVDLAPDKVRTAIAYAIQKGYVDSDPFQVQLAVWNLVDGRRLPGQTYDVADEIIRFAEDAAAPEPAGTRTLAAALGDKQVSATIADYKSTSPANYPYKGEGALLLQNLSNEAQTLILPYGFRFRDTGTEDVQDMGIFPVWPQQ